MPKPNQTTKRRLYYIRADMQSPLQSACYLAAVTMNSVMAHKRGVSHTPRFLMGETCLPAEMVIPMAEMLGMIPQAPASLATVRHRYAAAEAALYGYAPVAPLGLGVMGIRQLSHYLEVAVVTSPLVLTAIETAMAAGSPEAPALIAGMTRCSEADAAAYVASCASFNAPVLVIGRSAWTKAQKQIAAWELDGRVEAMRVLDGFRSMYAGTSWCTPPTRGSMYGPGEVGIPAHVTATMRAAAEKRDIALRLKACLEHYQAQVKAAGVALRVPTTDNPTAPAMPQIVWSHSASRAAAIPAPQKAPAESVARVPAKPRVPNPWADPAPVQTVVSRVDVTLRGGGVGKVPSTPPPKPVHPDEAPIDFGFVAAAFDELASEMAGEV
jgi:hypothetical protein